MAENKSGDVRFEPRFFEGDAKSFRGMGRLTGRKELDKDSSIEAYADLMASRDQDAGTKLSVPSVGLRYQKRFSKGGSASARADGCAQRGKTRGKIV